MRNLRTMQQYSADKHSNFIRELGTPRSVAGAAAFATNKVKAKAL